MSSLEMSSKCILGTQLRNLRESKNLLLRQVAAIIEIDQALLSKIERGERIATKNQVTALAKFYEVNKQELLTCWLGEKIAYDIWSEDVADDALKIAEKHIHYLRSNEKKDKEEK